MNLKNNLSSDSDGDGGLRKDKDNVVTDPNMSPMVVKVERKVVFGTKKKSMHVKKEYLDDTNSI